MRLYRSLLLTSCFFIVFSLSACKDDKKNDPAPAASGGGSSGGDDTGGDSTGGDSTGGDTATGGDDTGGDSTGGNPQSGSLSLSFETDTAIGTLPNDYNLTNGIDVPSTATAMNSSLPNSMQAGSIALGLTASFRLTASDCTSNQFWYATDQECIDVPVAPPVAMAQMDGGTANEQEFFDWFLGSCDNRGADGVISGDDVGGATTQNCIDAINAGKYGRPWNHDDDDGTTPEVTYLFGGVWSRYFSGVGPTSILRYLKQADETFQDFESRFATGQLRCLAGSHTNFSVHINTKDTWTHGVNAWPLSCYLGDDQSLGYKDNYFYYAQTPPAEGAVRQFIKVKDDAKELEVWNVFGYPGNNGSTGINHFKTREESDGSKYFFMNPMGAGMGPSCGTYLAFYTAPNGANLMYFKLAEQQPGVNNQACYDYTTPGSPTLAVDTFEVCLDGNFDILTSGECTSQNLHVTEFDLFEELLDGKGIVINYGDTNAIDGNVTAYNYAYLREDSPPATGTLNIPAKNIYADYISTFGVHNGTNPTFYKDGESAFSIEDLWPGNHPVAIKDPLKVITDRVFEMDTITHLADEIDERAQQMQGQIGDGSKQCLYDLPTAFEPTDSVGDEIMGVFNLTCAGNNNNTYGYVNDTWNWVRMESGSSMTAFRASADQADIWSIRMDGSTDTGTSYYDYSKQISMSHLVIDNVNGTKEFSMFGSKSALFEAYCGFQFKIKGNLIYVRGKFTDGQCSETFDDEDCLQLESDGALTRKDISFCYNSDNIDVTAFSSPMLSTTTFTKSEIATILSTVPAQETSENVAHATTDETPVADIDLTSWAAVDTLPLTVYNERFTRGDKDNGPVSKNCGTTPGDETRNISFSWSFDMASLNATEFADLQASITAGTAYIGYNMVRQATELGTASVSHTLQATATLTDASNTTLKTASISAHSIEGAYALSDFLDSQVAADSKVKIDWTGSVTLDCPDSPNSGDQGNIRVFVSDLKLRF